jgi:hypothetical protein
MAIGLHAVITQMSVLVFKDLSVYSAASPSTLKHIADA